MRTNLHIYVHCMITLFDIVIICRFWIFADEYQVCGQLYCQSMLEFKRMGQMFAQLLCLIFIYVPLSMLIQFKKKVVLSGLCLSHSVHAFQDSNEDLLRSTFIFPRLCYQYLNQIDIKRTRKGK